jgi:hypothetical protein
MAEDDLDGLMQEYLELGAIPHCYFPELCEKFLVTGVGQDAGVFYTSPVAFYLENGTEKPHVHISLAQVHHELIDSPVRFALNSGAEIVLSKEESAKLVEQAGFAASRINRVEEDIVIQEGEQLIFSTPDPALPPEFIQFLVENFKDQASAVYAFETTETGKEGNLVIALLPGENAQDLQLLSMQLAQGADMYLENRSQIDFMLLDPEEKELIEIIDSVSPEIF